MVFVAIPVFLRLHHLDRLGVLDALALVLSIRW